MNNCVRAAIAVVSVGLAATIASAQILIGQTAGFSGPVADGVKEVTDGARLWFDTVNTRGGILGQQIKLVSLDDKFDPKAAGENARELIENHNVVAMFLTRGTPHTQAVLPLLQKHGVALVGPSTGAFVLHQPPSKFVFNVRATYQREAEKAIEHLHTLGIGRVAVVYANDSFGKDGLEGANKGFAHTRLKAVASIAADRDKPDFAAIIAQLTDTQAQAVLWIGSGKVVGDGIRGLRSAGSAAQVVTLSNNASTGFIKSLGGHARGVIVTQVFPYERSIAYGLVKEAQELARQRKLGDISPAMLEGFAAAKVLTEGLRRTGAKPTRERLIAALETLRPFDLGGLELSFGPDDRTGLDFADLSIIGNDGRFLR